MPVTNSMRKNMMWTLPIVMSFWVVLTITMAQPKCGIDAHCRSNQYCYRRLQLCMKYTNCSNYNRAEAVTPAREPEQCGNCLDGYSTESVISNNSCVNVNSTSETISLYLKRGIPVLTIVCVVVYVIHVIISQCK